ncbi:hypothetical protein O181_080034 [Austropuccinia psidii MF-1]|uniref:Uncharacterized protein n=1 Tax=Austropuccinia psidii MF-1 TaxID=1389203 RepID=A0A9Q3FK39_9BASI|nr:hypothetical protein [Austropuccinia psidii MF-1]
MNISQTNRRCVSEHLKTIGCVNAINIAFTCPKASCHVYNSNSPSIDPKRPEYIYFHDCNNETGTKLFRLVFTDHFTSDSDSDTLLITKPLVIGPQGKIITVPDTVICKWKSNDDLNAWRPSCGNCVQA